MITRLSCPYLTGEVELTEEREQHIAPHHPDLLPEYRDRLAETLADPDRVRLSSDSDGARIFSRWYASTSGGKHIVVVVVTDDARSNRSWVVTAYITRKLTGGVTEWTRI